MGENVGLVLSKVNDTRRVSCIVFSTLAFSIALIPTLSERRRSKNLKDKTRSDLWTHLNQRPSSIRVLNDSLPLMPTVAQRWCMSDDVQRGPRSRQGDIHSASVLEETNARSGVGCTRSDTREDDDVFLLTLETIDRVEAERSDGHANTKS